VQIPTARTYSLVGRGLLGVTSPVHAIDADFGKQAVLTQSPLLP
jgi:hypothetical protein